MRRSVLRHLAPPTDSLDNRDSAHDPAAADVNLDDGLGVVSALARIAPIHREALERYYFADMPKRWRSRPAQCCRGWRGRAMP